MYQVGRRIRVYYFQRSAPFFFSLLLLLLGFFLPSFGVRRARALLSDLISSFRDSLPVTVYDCYSSPRVSLPILLRKLLLEISSFHRGSRPTSVRWNPKTENFFLVQRRFVLFTVAHLPLPFSIFSFGTLTRLAQQASC